MLLHRQDGQDVGHDVGHDVDHDGQEGGRAEVTVRLPLTLRSLRVAANLSASDVARRVGVSERRWYRWERGDNLPPPQYWDGIMAALDCSHATLAQCLMTYRKQNTNVS
jgi:hypothetical protein